MADALYDAYEQWKGWSAEAFMAAEPREWASFTAELGDRTLRGEPVLDIGFGNGTFLGWAAAQGAALHGAEISDHGIVLAERRGVTIVPVDLAVAARLYPSHFALIAAFDVLEHLTRAEIEAFMDNVALMLRPGGWFIARFPNGQSPFGRIHQHGDATHITILSAPILRQLIRDKPFTIVRAGDPRIARSGSIVRRCAQVGRDLARSGTERIIKILFGVDAPLDSNTIVLAERT